MKFFTIGYGGRPPEAFVKILQQHGIRTVVDVRVTPQRASMGAYVLAKSPDKGIQKLLASGGIGYKWVPELGNPFKDEADWPTRYADLLGRDADRMLSGLAGVEEPFCLLCAEKRVAECHRRQLADVLVARRHAVQHIE